MLCVALAGCGNDDEGRVAVSGGPDTTGGTETTGTSTDKTAPGGAPIATVKIAETEYRLSPADPSVGRPGVVAFEVTNAGKIVHALEVEGPEGEVETDAIEPGKSATLKADLSKAGRYEWYCPVGDHEQRGMKGEITVAGGGGDEPDGGPGSDAHGGY